MWEFLKAPFLVLHFSYDVIYNIGIHADGTTVYSKFIQASDLWQQLESASESESDLWDTVDWGRKWMLFFGLQSKWL